MRCVLCFRMAVETCSQIVAWDGLFQAEATLLCMLSIRKGPREDTGAGLSPQVTGLP